MKQMGHVIILDPWECYLASRVLKEAFRDGKVRGQQKRRGMWHFECADVEAAQWLIQRIQEVILGAMEASP